ncbi:MAG: hypothetical protein R2711_11900 [Acidimicrobiales bacterium]
MKLHLHAKKPGDERVPEPVDLEVSYDEALGPLEEAYRANCSTTPWTATPAASVGPTPSTSSGASWRTSSSTEEVHLYTAGTMGPKEADRLAADAGGWIDPLPPTS